MPVVPIREILDPAFAERYGVPAINIINDLSIDAVLAAAVERELARHLADLRQDGGDVRPRSALRHKFTRHRQGLPRCRSPCTWTTARERCRSSPTAWTAGWNSVLFDAHELDVAENLVQTTAVVKEGGRARRARRGRDRGHPGHQGRHRLGPVLGPAEPVEIAVDFIKTHRRGTASPRPSATPTGSTRPRPSWSPPSGSPTWWRATGIPMALHGGNRDERPNGSPT